jgi:hypothetical protein
MPLQSSTFAAGADTAVRNLFNNEIIERKRERPGGIEVLHALRRPGFE